MLLALICAAPVVASYVVYYWMQPQARTNYGELLEPGPAPGIAGQRLDGRAFRLSELAGSWVLIMADGASCTETCERKLYATRQARTIQGRERERVVRVLLQPPDAPPLDAALRAQHPGLIVARVDPAQWTPPSALGAAAPGIVLVDPLGNLVLRYPTDPDIKRLAKDLERLLRASRIG
jgi:cytochrome oxidase Cu insertion factor (SCO1/SenC/PrrC family)